MSQQLTFPRQQALTRRFRLGAPRAFRPLADRVLFLRSRGGRDPLTCLWSLELSDGSERLVVDPAALLGASDEDLPPEERARRERMREVTGGVTAYALDSAGTVASFAISGVPYAIHVDDPAATAVEIAAPGPVIDPRVDPTGTRVAYVSGRGLHVSDIGSTSWSSLCEPESETVSWGLADFIAAEELERVRGFWWLPSGDALLVERVDDEAVQQWWISDPAQPGSEPTQHRYPAAGTANAEVSLWLITLDGSRREVAWEHATYPYLASVSTSASGDPLVSVMTRDQATRLTLAVSGDGSAREVARHTDPSWVDVVPGAPTWSPDGRLVDVVPVDDAYRVVVSEAPLSPVDLQVDSIIDVDETGIVVTAWKGTTHHAYAIDWAGETRCLAAPLDTVSSATRGGSVTVVISSSLDRTTSQALVLRDEGAPIEVTSHAETPVVSPQVTIRDLAGLRAAVLWPREHITGSGRLPILMAPYGGPHHSRVIESGAAFCEDQWWADQGFCVVVVDGRGTPGRGPAWERAVYRDVAGPVLEDQVAAVQALIAEFPDELDGSRVAIRGWSFGGYLSALAVLDRPDVFHAAVAGAPVTEWRLYDTAYTERYLGNPAEDPAPYDATSLIPRARNLDAALMIVHGLADDNVVAAHTLALSGALLEAGKPHTVLPLSGVTHMTPQEVVAENLLLLELEFLRRSLG